MYPQYFYPEDFESFIQAKPIRAPTGDHYLHKLKASEVLTVFIRKGSCCCQLKSENCWKKYQRQAALEDHLNTNGALRQYYWWHCCHPIYSSDGDRTLLTDRKQSYRNTYRITQSDQGFVIHCFISEVATAAKHQLL